MKIIFGTIAKNIEQSITQLFYVCNEVRNKIPDAHIFIYENNSTDDTTKFFPILGCINPNVHIISETLSNEDQLHACKAITWDNKPCRMELIAIARNKLLEMIHKFGVKDDDYVVFFDNDMYKPFDVSQILDRIHNFPSDLDAMFANGLNMNGQTYYDGYAYRDNQNPYGPELIGDKWWKNLKPRQIQTMTEVYSAFGGLAIYRGYCIKDNKYSAIPTVDLDNLYKKIKAQNNHKNEKPHIHNEGVLLGMYLFGKGPFKNGMSMNSEDIFYMNNSGYNFPVVCEHTTFHATLIMRNQGRFVIDPNLYYYSTH